MIKINTPAIETAASSRLAARGRAKEHKRIANARRERINERNRLRRSQAKAAALASAADAAAAAAGGSAGEALRGREASSEKAGGATAPPLRKAIPQLEVWERRLIDPSNRGNREILLKQGGFELRTINTEVTGRYQEAVYSQGWIPVRADELADRDQIAGLVDRGDGLVRTGPSGVYLLCKMPKTVYDAIANRKVEIGRSIRRSAQKQRELIMERAGARDPRGADIIGRMRGEITELVERVDMDEADLTPDMPVLGDEASAGRKELA